MMRAFDKDFWIFSFAIIVLCVFFVNIARAESPKLVRAEYDIYEIVDRVVGDFDFSQTIKALIYIESRDGLYPVNLNDPACGVTHININTYIKRHKLKNTPFNRNKACADLIASPEWAILNAVEELTFWKQIHCKQGKCSKAQYANVIKSYNAGWNYRGAKAQEYWQEYKKTFKMLWGGKK